MKAIVRMLVGSGAALCLLVFSVPAPAAADPCPETEVARILCPNRPGYYFQVCQDHHGIITVHNHCIVPQ